MAEVTTVAMDQDSDAVVGKRALRSWIGYDFFNSLLIINGSIYYSAWITQRQHGSPVWYVWTYAFSTLLLLLTLPLNGACIDRYGRGRTWLFGTTLGVVLSTVVLWILGRSSDEGRKTVGTLIAFGSVNYFYQASLVAYNWLLPQLSECRSPRALQRISGYGLGSGSLGSIVGIVLGMALFAPLRHLPNAELDLLLIMACLFFCLFLLTYPALRSDLGPRESSPRGAGSFREALSGAARIVLRASPARLYLLGFLLFADGLLTVQLNVPIFMRGKLGFGNTGVSVAVAMSLAFGVVGALLFAHWLHGLGLLKRIILALVLWTAALCGLAVVSANWAFWVVMCVCGVLYGFLWSASRAYMLAISARKQLGGALSWYAVFERGASVIGPLLWGAVMALPMPMSARYTWAMFSMAAMVLGGLLVVSKGKENALVDVAVGEEGAC